MFWGKLAQREKMTQTEYISKPSQYFDLISNSNIIVKNVEIFDNECPFILVNYETKLEHIDTHATANVIVGSYVTAYARLELYKVLEKLQKRVLYFDTDSCMYIHDPKLWNPRIINSRLGNGLMKSQIVKLFVSLLIKIASTVDRKGDKEK